MTRRALTVAVVLGAVTCTGLGATSATPPGVTTRVSLSSTGQQVPAGGGSFIQETPSVSDGGRYVAFSSPAPLVPEDVNGTWDVYVRDRLLERTVRVSAPYGARASGRPSTSPVISGNGRYVAFVSQSPHLVPGTTTTRGSVYVRDLRARTTVQADVTPAGAPGDGAVSPGRISLSADGRSVSFASTSTDLVAGDTNGVSDVFVRDLVAGTTRRASVSSAGTQGAARSLDTSISADGQHVAFASAATLVAGDTNRSDDIFVRDLAAGTTSRVSLTASGGQATSSSSFVGADSPSISADGSRVVFATTYTLVPLDQRPVYDVYLRDRTAGTTVLVSQTTSGGDRGGASVYPMISADGRLVAFESDNGITPEDRGGVLVRDLAAGRTTFESRSTTGDIGGGNRPALSGDGRLLVFDSYDALVPDDTNGESDVYLRVLR